MIVWPDSGELQRRITIRLWSDVPNSAFGLDKVEDSGIQRWAKLEPIYGLANRDGAQTGEAPTHLFWVRYGIGTRPEDITNNHVVEWNGRRYRVLDSINIEDEQRFTRISCKDLGNLA